MRLIEILLLGVLLLPILWRLFSRSRPAWLAAFPIAGVLLILLHAWQEGLRWQMVPAYLLTAVLVIPLLRRNVDKSQAPRWTRAAAGLGLLVWLIAAALPAAMPVPQLPPPTGPYAVGTFSTYLVDENRLETYTTDPSDNRELMMQVWYPTEARNGDRAKYIENLDVAGPVLADQFELPSFLLDHINLTRLDVWQHSPAAESGTPFPVIIFSHGLTGIRMQNSVMVRELVSHGYIVAAVDHSYASALTIFPDDRLFIYEPSRIFPSGRSNATEAKPLVKVWAGDIAFILDVLAGWQSDPAHPLNGRLDLNRVGVFGHSTGGGATVEFCLQDNRCRAGVGLDSWLLPVSDSVLTQGPEQPFMFFGTPRWLGADNRRRGETIFNNLRRDGYWLTLENTGHYDFTDMPLLSPLTPQLGLSGTINSAYSLEIQNRYLLAFFDRYLKGNPSELLSAPSAYPELTIALNLRP